VRWPWVSRAAFDVVVDERDRLRGQVEKLQEHVIRMDRVEHGTSEVPREPRPAMEPMPKELLEYCNSYGDARIRKTMRDAAFKQHRQGVPWSQIKLEIMGRVDGHADIAASAQA
jgi:hypothetical protein